MKKKFARLELISIVTKYGCIILFIFFHFSSTSCNTLRNYQVKGECTPIAFLGKEELENKKELKKEEVISIIKKRFCLADARQFQEVSIRFKNIDYVTGMPNLLKSLIYLWYWRDVLFSYELEYSAIDKEGKITSGILKKEVKYKVMEIRTFPFTIIGFFIVENPSLIVIFIVHPFATSALLIEEGYFQSHNNFALEQMTDNLIKEIVIKANQDEKE